MTQEALPRIGVFVCDCGSNIAGMLAVSFFFTEITVAARQQFYGCYFTFSPQTTTLGIRLTSQRSLLEHLR